LDEKNELMQKMSNLKPEISQPITQPKPASDHSAQKPWTPSSSYFDRKKRHRRTAVEIERHYRCPFPDCLKSYGYFLGKL